MTKAWRRSPRPARVEQELKDENADQMNEPRGLFYAPLATGDNSAFGIVKMRTLSIFERTRELGLLCASG